MKLLIGTMNIFFMKRNDLEIEDFFDGEFAYSVLDLWVEVALGIFSSGRKSVNYPSISDQYSISEHCVLTIKILFIASLSDFSPLLILLRQGHVFPNQPQQLNDFSKNFHHSLSDGFFIF